MRLFSLVGPALFHWWVESSGRVIARVQKESTVCCGSFAPREAHMNLKPLRATHFRENLICKTSLPISTTTTVVWKNDREHEVRDL